MPQKLHPYMKPWSCGSMACRPPSDTAFLTISSTSALLSQDIAKSPSVCIAVSHSARLVPPSVEYGPPGHREIIGRRNLAR
jgi:hypothetical protein